MSCRLQQQIVGHCRPLAQTGLGRDLPTARQGLEERKLERAQPCIHLASPMSLTWILSDTSIFCPLLYCIPSMVNLTQLAALVSSMHR